MQVLLIFDYFDLCIIVHIDRDTNVTNIDVGDDESDDKDSDSDSGCSVSLRSWKGDLSLSWQSGLVKIVFLRAA